jgi:hypothetical protein
MFCLNYKILYIINMEYATNITGNVCDKNFLRYVGYEQCNPALNKLYDPTTIKMVSNKISELLRGVDPQNKRIVVPDDIICDVISGCYDNYRPPTGDIFSRYIIPNDKGPNDNVQNIINQAIELITMQVRNTMEMNQNNEKLTIWTTVLGDFNEHKLRQHAPIKVLKKRPAPMQFNMNY